MNFLSVLFLLNSPELGELSSAELFCEANVDIKRSGFENKLSALKSVALADFPDIMYFQVDAMLQFKFIASNTSN